MKNIESKFEKLKKSDFFQKVVGVILDFMATFWDHDNGFFDDAKIQTKSGFKIVFGFSTFLRIGSSPSPSAASAGARRR